MDTMIELPALRRSAELAPNTVDADARTVEVIWSAGARVRRASFFGEPYDEELSLDPAHVRLDRLNAGAPFLKVHEIDTLDAVIGSVVPGSARIQNGLRRSVELFKRCSQDALAPLHYLTIGEACPQVPVKTNSSSGLRTRGVSSCWRRCSESDSGSPR
mgnify:CR=1 FL=1